VSNERDNQFNRELGGDWHFKFRCVVGVESGRVTVVVGEDKIVERCQDLH
jgi:hypothetical protein